MPIMSMNSIRHLWQRWTTRTAVQLFGNDVVFTQRFLSCCGFYQGALDGQWGPLTDAAASRFDQASLEIADRLGRFDTRSERNITTLHPRVQEAARACLRRLLDAGFNAKVISGTRSYAEQTALYNQGRFGNPGKVVTKAKAGSSFHNFGLAFDLGLFAPNGAYLEDEPSYDAASRVAKVPGLEWGGDWQGFVDRPHYQLPHPTGVTGARADFERGTAFA